MFPKPVVVCLSDEAGQKLTMEQKRFMQKAKNDEAMFRNQQRMQRTALNQVRRIHTRRNPAGHSQRHSRAGAT